MEETPHFSTVSYSFLNRFTAETVEEIFAWILTKVAEVGYLSPKAVFIDGTHIKANANTKKQMNEVMPEYMDLYRERKEKIERVFADAKEKHGMRYTPYRGLRQVTN